MDKFDMFWPISDEELRAAVKPKPPFPEVHTCPVCGTKYTFDSDGNPYHVACDFDGDHDVCSPDDRHIPVAGSPC